MGDAVDVVAQRSGRHPESWWAQFPEASERFDAAYTVDGLGELILPHIPSPLLRREAEIATDIVVRRLERPNSPEAAERADTALRRFVATLERITERSTGTGSIAEALALCDALQGKCPAAAAACEPYVGTVKLEKLFVTALRLDYFDIPLALRLLEGGQEPARAVRSGLLIGKYSWWPAWLLNVVTERALAGTLDEETIVALDNCAYASLSPAQARLARHLLRGDPRIIGTAVTRLEVLGEPDAAARLREGDLQAVALAARLMPL
ncbi:hypothetical protein [Krasilnikovia sp. MM14-A1004]|uniref:hypothetical protein n=1 Tax=Krasilnikovia sp. MM14-A1004 TaxID=3373541 RepID=UPI00399CAEF9